MSKYTFDDVEPAQMQIRDEPDYTTTWSASSSTQWTAWASRTTEHTVIGLTTIAAVTSETTVTALPPTEAPLLSSSQSSTTALSPGKIAGIVLGSITGLLLLLLLVYLLLTRARWVARMAALRLEEHEEKHRKRARRGSRRARSIAREEGPVRGETVYNNSLVARERPTRPPRPLWFTPEVRQLLAEGRAKARVQKDERDTMADEELEYGAI
ncbi:hypothetical protein GGR50DRAFT_634936 [Xylaria sp. CBS 124048]|nr:hypothetical protein GGR50DRAFT_634936 [Xylaria sp. CBS 124048]